MGAVTSKKYESVVSGWIQQASRGSRILRSQGERLALQSDDEVLMMMLVVLWSADEALVQCVDTWA